MLQSPKVIMLIVALLSVPLALLSVEVAPQYAFACNPRNSECDPAPERPPRSPPVTQPQAPPETCTNGGLQRNMAWCLNPDGATSSQQSSARTEIYRGYYCDRPQDIRHGYELCQEGQAASHFKECSEQEHLQAVREIVRQDQSHRPASCPSAAGASSPPIVRYSCQYQNPSIPGLISSCECDGGLGSCPYKYSGADCSCGFNSGYVVRSSG
jgi:hypothetical protein